LSGPRKAVPDLYCSHFFKVILVGKQLNSK